MMQAQRGQAIVETTVFLPAFIFVLFAVIWGVQTAIVNERLQVAVRYSGLISSEINPYMEYSLYVVYNNLGSNVGVAPQQCYTPSPDALTNSGSYPGPASGSFFTPVNVIPTCAPAQTSFGTGGGAARPELVRSDYASISAASVIPGLFRDKYGWTGSTTTLGAQTNFIKTPDLGTVMHCYPALNAAVSASLSPSAATSTLSAIPPALPSNVTAPLVTAASCGS